MGERLKDKRVLVTQAGDYMGPAVVSLFRDEGAYVMTSEGVLSADGVVDELIDASGASGDIDELIANLALKTQSKEIESMTDELWHGYFDALVHPLMKLVRSVTPQMKERQSGKIVAITSAAPLRGFGRLPHLSAYCAARGAQNAFIRATGLELAPHNVQVNAIAQNYVKNPTFYPDELIETADFQQHVKQAVPAHRLGESWEMAELALFLASDKSDFMVGQVLPFAGGWTTTTG